MIKKEFFGISKEGKEIFKYIIKNNKYEVCILDYGATVLSFKILDKSVDIALGYDSLIEYEENSAFMGATIGRCANRIDKGKFTLNNVNYQLSVKADEHLHGGKGFDKKVWQTDIKGENMLTMRYISFNGEEGYCGTVVVICAFLLEEKGLKISFFAESDLDTIVNLTNHIYFNLKGEGSILDDYLMINSDLYMPINDKIVPTGEIKSVTNTPFDFREYKKIGDVINNTELTEIGGFDHNFILSKCGANMSLVAKVKNEHSGIELIISSSQPSMQLYTANKLNEKGKGNHFYKSHSGLCIEPQFPPNAINFPYLKSPVLKKGEIYEQSIEYKIVT
ncbi:MAG: aldose epimerase family protein [Clostridia bacterium]